MAAEQVNDPNLRGGQRDAFPGEVVAPGQEKTLQRLMREEEQRFASDLTEVKATGKLLPSEEDAVRRFAKLRAEVQRAKYLEALNSNPANIIKNIIAGLNKGSADIIEQSLFKLNENIARLQREIDIAKSSDKMSGKNQDTEQNVKKYLNITGSRDTLIEMNILNPVEETSAFQLVKKLGFLPVDTLTSLTDLGNAVKALGGPGNSDKPFAFGNIPGIGRIPSNTPGLEGIRATIFFDNFSFNKATRFIILGTPQALARIVDKGQYVPYQSQT